MKFFKTLRSFTLIELLVVISIIALLAGLALPALAGAMNAAKKAEANSMMYNLKVGITAFNTEYGTWPSDNAQGGNPPPSDTLSPANAYIILAAQDTSSTAQNSRQIVFMEFKSTEISSNSGSPEVIDPWFNTMKQNAEQNYHIQVDSTYTNVITIGAGPFSGTSINAGVAIWDPGVPTGHPASPNLSNTNSALHTW